MTATIIPFPLPFRQSMPEAAPVPVPANVPVETARRIAEACAPTYSPEVATKRERVKYIADGAGDWKNSRGATIAALREALKARTGRAWSVTGGTGTAYGWIAITAPPARRTWQSRPLPHNPGGYLPGKENWESYDAGTPGHEMSPEDTALLKSVFPDAGHQGESIAACNHDRELHLALALYGETLGFTFERYWD